MDEAGNIFYILADLKTDSKAHRRSLMCMASKFGAYVHESQALALKRVRDEIPPVKFLDSEGAPRIVFNLRSIERERRLELC